MTQHDTNKSRNCWRNARERERMKARYEIRERVASLVAAQVSQSTLENGPSKVMKDHQLPRNESSQEVLLNNDVKKQIHHFLRRIEAGSSSSFSLACLSNNYQLVSRPIPTNMLSTFKITTLCTSRFGKQEAIKVLQCSKVLKYCTFMEYATWLGEYKVLCPLLIGGIDPTLRGIMVEDPNLSNDRQEEEQLRRRAQNITSRVMKRFFDTFPRSLSSYIAKRVIDMRKEGLLRYTEAQHCKHPSCPICLSSLSLEFPALLCFGDPCFHCFCESCLWEDLIDNIDNRVDGDVMLCPICQKSPSHENDNAPGVTPQGEMTETIGDSPATRYQISLEKFNKLPANAQELKKRPKKKTTKRGVLCSSWSEAVSSSLGNSQNVRRDKWFGYTERNAVHYVRGCLVAGIDVNLTNEYGQTALHVASQRGYVDLVTVLLRFGADAGICAHGGLTMQSISEAKGHKEIIEVLKEHDRYSESTERSPFQWTMQTHESTRNLTQLIDSSRNHPGAGAFYIDNSLSPSTIEQLIQLWRSIPVSQTDRKKAAHLQELCSARSYYCDADGAVCQLLKDAIQQYYPSIFVFEHMRFLHYLHQGSVLAPHVDLSRVNTTGQRSTHTFILYLSDCELGGETSLLEGLTGEKQVLAKVSPRRGRLLVFPHSCPHEGNEVQSLPKLLLRGEVMLGTT